jgi:ATP-dependent Lon protease
LRDRLEIIEIPSYTAAEKVQIARRHLLPRQLEEHGLKRKHLRLPDATLKKLIHDYTREAGVRNLEREIGALVRKVARKIVAREGIQSTITILPKELTTYLGAPRFQSELAEAERVWDRDRAGLDACGRGYSVY